MPSDESVRPASYVPRRYTSGTFPVSRDYALRQMLYNYAHAKGRDDAIDAPSDQVIPSFPFSDVPLYADTLDIESQSVVTSTALAHPPVVPPALAFHHFWGCLLTPDNVAARIGTDDLRYHVWVAAKRVVESGL